tara:strand:- start:507 stop:752 length:246 start_codon:yes stop_codon:yes gene_type:complete
MIKITKGHNQYVLNSDTGLVVTFETAEMLYGMMLVLKRKVAGVTVGVATLMGDPMNEALEQMHELGIKMIKREDIKAFKHG